MMGAWTTRSLWRPEGFTSSWKHLLHVTYSHLYILITPKLTSTKVLMEMMEQCSRGEVGIGGICLSKKNYLWFFKLSSVTISVRNSNLGLCFFHFECCVSQLSVTRFGNNFEGIMTLGQVKSSPNFCSFGSQRAEKRNIWRRKNTNINLNSGHW